MVNDAVTDAPTERRQRERLASHDGTFGAAKLNPFGELVPLQHLAIRLAPRLPALFEPMLRRELRGWAEPLSVERFADTCTARGGALTAWLPISMAPGGGSAIVVLDGRFVLELLDCFFGGTGVAPVTLPEQFSLAAGALLERFAGKLAPLLETAWEPLAPMVFAAQPPVDLISALPLGPDDAVVVTRFGLAHDDQAPIFVDILYPVAALKPHATALTGKVLDKVEPAPAWRNALTRNVMDVTFEVRSVLAEPVVPLAMLTQLKVGDVIPVALGPDVPVMIGTTRLGHGTVGTANGQAAIKLTAITREGIPQ